MNKLFAIIWGILIAGNAGVAIATFIFIQNGKLSLNWITGSIIGFCTLAILYLIYSWKVFSEPVK